jgi:hypothetical protein
LTFNEVSNARLLGTFARRKDFSNTRGQNRTRVSTADEKRISGEDSLIPAVLHIKADTVLRMTRRVDALDADGTQLEDFIVGGCLCDSLAVFAADDVYLGVVQLSQLDT